MDTPQARLLPSFRRGLRQTEAGLLLPLQLQALENVPGSPTSVPSSVPASHEKDSSFPLNFQINKIALLKSKLITITISSFLIYLIFSSLIFTSTDYLHSVSKMQYSKYPLFDNFYIE